jgi:hypothetical protein
VHSCNVPVVFTYIFVLYLRVYRRQEFVWFGYAMQRPCTDYYPFVPTVVNKLDVIALLISVAIFLPCS